MNANRIDNAAVQKSLGRAWSSADLCRMVKSGDWFRVEFWWNDGAMTYDIHETEAEALKQVARNGFSACLHD